MARIENTVFISYRRSDVYTALAVYENLKNQGYDVFFDYRSISSGDFEQIITSNIRARAHFLLILTPTALERCNEPGDWLRREIEFAIDEKRNIIPLFFKGFRFGIPSVTEKLTGKFKNLSRYNGLNVHEDYFDEAMHRLSAQYLNIPLETVLHPVSTEVQRVVRAEQVAADKALEQIEDVKELVRQGEEKPAQEREIPKPVAVQTVKSVSTVPWRTVAGLAGGLILIAFLVWGGSKLLLNLPAATSESTRTFQTIVTFTAQPSITVTSQPKLTNTPLPAETSIPPTPTRGIDSTMISDKDGMTLLYVPAGEFTMGTVKSSYPTDASPAHAVYLDAFWIDRTEVTNAMYAKCVQSDNCQSPNPASSKKHSNYYGNPEFDNYPVIFVSWDMAKTYCEWAERRLPTEAEWEKAARGEDGRSYPWGDDRPPVVGDLLNWSNIMGDTTEVEKYPNGASPYGVLDMSGNVSEWVADRYDPAYYNISPSSNPSGPNFGQYHVVRGGSWNTGDSRYVSSIIRYRYLDFPRSEIGFRCAMDANP